MKNILGALDLPDVCMEAAAGMVGAVAGDMIGGTGGAAVGAVASLFFQRSVKFIGSRFRSGRLEDKLQELKELVKTARGITESVEGNVLNDPSWYDRLLSAAEEGEEVINSAQCQEMTIRSSDTATKHFNIKSGLKRVRDTTRKVIVGNGNVFTKIDEAIVVLKKELVLPAAIASEVITIGNQINKRRRLYRCEPTDEQRLLHQYCCKAKFSYQVVFQQLSALVSESNKRSYELDLLDKWRHKFSEINNNWIKVPILEEKTGCRCCKPEEQDYCCFSRREADMLYELALSARSSMEELSEVMAATWTYIETTLSTTPINLHFAAVQVLGALFIILLGSDLFTETRNLLERAGMLEAAIEDPFDGDKYNKGLNMITTYARELKGCLQNGLGIRETIVFQNFREYRDSGVMMNFEKYQPEGCFLISVFACEMQDIADELHIIKVEEKERTEQKYPRGFLQLEQLAEVLNQIVYIKYHLERHIFHHNTNSILTARDIADMLHNRNLRDQVIDRFMASLYGVLQSSGNDEVGFIRPRSVFMSMQYLREFYRILKNKKFILLPHNLWGANWVLCVNVSIPEENFVGYYLLDARSGAYDKSAPNFMGCHIQLMKDVGRITESTIVECAAIESPKQQFKWQSGYFVMRFMLDIVRNVGVITNLKEDFGQMFKEYRMDVEIREVKELWSNFIFDTYLRDVVEKRVPRGSDAEAAGVPYTVALAC